LTFEILLYQLREHLREKVKNGQLTERGMARATGVSQPHLHNILKGIRALPPELADQLMLLSGFTLPGLMTLKPQSEEEMPKPGADSPHERKSPHPEAIPSTIGNFPLHFPAFQLEPDPSMEPRFRGGDIVYYGHGALERSVLQPEAAYLVAHNGVVRVRYLRMGGQRLYMASEETLRDPVRWDYVSLADRHILEIVRGRIVWICRKMDQAETSAPEKARGLD
jgi:plasmid maintenance system antidote protein VapI